MHKYIIFWNKKKYFSHTENSNIVDAITKKDRTAKHERPGGWRTYRGLFCEIACTRRLELFIFFYSELDRLTFSAVSIIHV